jgi:hypothetical protein
MFPGNRSVGRYTSPIYTLIPARKSCSAYLKRKWFFDPSFRVNTAQQLSSALYSNRQEFQEDADRIAVDTALSFG